LQYGYLLEIPLLLVAVGLLVAILFPKLPPMGQKVLVSVAALPVLYSLYYVIVTPGWMPGNEPGNERLKPTLRLLTFLLLAVMIVACVAFFVLGE
jgi:hypothetical protein